MRVSCHLDRFFSMTYVYFNDMEINRGLYLLTSPWEIFLRCDMFRNRIDQKIPSMAFS